MEYACAMGFDLAMEQVKYFFINQELNFGLLDLAKDIEEIKGETNQPTTPNQVHKVIDQIQASPQLGAKQVPTLEKMVVNPITPSLQIMSLPVLNKKFAKKLST